MGRHAPRLTPGGIKIASLRDAPGFSNAIALEKRDVAILAMLPLLAMLRIGVGGMSDCACGLSNLRNQRGFVVDFDTVGGKLWIAPR
jgi:hypothetical protein